MIAKSFHTAVANCRMADHNDTKEHLEITYINKII